MYKFLLVTFILSCQHRIKYRNKILNVYDKMSYKWRLVARKGETGQPGLKKANFCGKKKKKKEGGTLYL